MGPSLKLPTGSRLFQLVVAGVLIVAVGTMLMWRFVDEVRTTTDLSSSRVAASSRAVLQQRDCLVGELHELVPRGSTVYIGPPTPANYLHLYEIIAGWAYAEPQSASTRTVQLVANGPCDGLGLRVVEK